MPETTYPNTFYRVSVKAFVANDKGGILVLKENQNTWSLPGGGLDHGEDPIVGLRRELKEELVIQAIDSITPLCIKTFYLESTQTWLMWIVFDVTLSSHDFTLGNGVTEAKFTHTDELKDSTDIFEKLVHEVANEEV